MNHSDEAGFSKATAAVSDSAAAKKRSTDIHKMTGTAMLAAVAFVLQYLELSVPVMPFFIKFDFSDLPALLGAYAYGPLTGIFIELIKNILHCAVSQSATVGELSNFLLGAVFTGVAGLIYRHKKSKHSAFIGGLAGAIAMGLVCVPSNYFIVYPFYYKAFMPEPVVLEAYQVILPGVRSVFESLLIFNLPFTIIKGLISLLISMLIYQPLRPLLKGKN